MDKRLIRLLKTYRGGHECVMLDTYNQAAHEDVACTIRTNINTANHHFIMEKIEVVGRKHKGQSGVVYGDNGIAPTITTNKGDGLLLAESDNTQNYVVIPSNTKDGEIRCELGGVIDIAYPSSKTRRGRVQEDGTVSPTLTCGCESHLVRIDHSYRIRKLTERECFRLMGVSDDMSDEIRAAVSKAQCYKLAGNSIVVDVLEAIFRELLTKHEIPKLHQLKAF